MEEGGLLQNLLNYTPVTTIQMPLGAVFCRVANPLENLPSGGSSDGGCDPWCSKQWSILTVCCLLLPKVISLNGMKM